MKIGKIIFSLIGVIILVVAGLAWYVLSNINGIVKDVVETQGTKVLQTPVKLNHVDVKLFDGSAELGLFSVKNYAGFEQENLLSFETIKVAIEPSSINTDVIVLDEVTISGISVVAEQKGTTTNLQTLLSKFPKSDSASKPEPAASEGQEILLAIKKLNFVDNSLSLATEDYGTHTLDLPKIVQTNLGTDSGGLTPEQLAVQVIRPLIKEAQAKIEKKLVDIAKQKLQEKYGEKVEQEKQKLKSKIKESLGTDAEGAESKLEGLKKLL